MNIGVDARPLEIAQRAGINNYIYHVLANIYDENVCLYFKSKPESDLFIDRPNISKKIIQLPFYRWKMEQIWESNFLPWQVNKYKTDVFWGGRFYVPSGLKCKSVATIHDLAFLKIPGLLPAKAIKYFDRLIKESVKSANSFIAISETTKSDFCYYYNVPPNKVNVIFNGYSSFFKQEIENDQIKLALTKLGITQPYILFVGTLEPRKNLKNLFRAFKESDAFKQGISLVICGKMGWFSGEFLAEIKPLIESKKLIIIGFVSDHELLCLYKGSLFFAFPSLYEGFGIPVLEAMAAGVPVLTSNNSSMKELFESSTEQIDPNNIESIKTGINNLLDNDLRSNLIIRGTDAVGNYSWSKCAKEHVNHFINF